MNFVLFGAAPLVLIGAFAGWRIVRGRPLRRYTLNVIVALCLAVYFLITAALGIFWVANQELPVFDVHYLFGYFTLLLVAAHIAINFKPLTRFVRSQSPKRMLTPEGRAFRPSLRAAAKLTGLMLFGYACYLIGVGEASTSIEVRSGEVVGEPVRAARQAKPATSLRVARGDGGALPRPQPGRRQLVTVDGVEQELAEYYHRRTKHTRESVMRKRFRLDWSQRPIVYKRYVPSAMVALPRDFETVQNPTGQAIDAGRTLPQALEPGHVTLRQLSTLLHLTNGITAIKRYPRISYDLRAAPSAGALFPTLTYVLVKSVEGLAPGLYHYDVKQHQLRLLRDDDGLVEDLASTSARGDLIRNASFTLLFSAEFYRSSWKYRERSWRYSLLDTGHVAVQAMIVGAAMGLSSAPIGRFDDAHINAMLDLNPAEESVLLIVPIGRASAPAAQRAEPVFVAHTGSISSDRVPSLITLLQGRTGLTLSGAGQVQPFDMPGAADPPQRGPLTMLGAGRQPGDALDATIKRRRSERRWGDDGMTSSQLSSVLYHSFGLKDGTSPDPSVQSSYSLTYYAVIQNVRGMDPGVYVYLPRRHALSLIRAGEHRTTTLGMALFQEVVGDSDVVLIMTSEPRAMEYPDGARGYRYAQMDAGMAGGRVYLQTVAMGLGCTGIGAFFDDEVSELIKRAPDDEHIIYLMAIGTPSGIKDKYLTVGP